MLRPGGPMTTLRAVTARLFDRLRDDTVTDDTEYVLAPSSIDEAAAVLAAASEAGMLTTFRGGGTHTGIGHPVAADLVITTTRLAAIVDWRPDDLTVVVEAGVPIGLLDGELAKRNQTAIFFDSTPGSTVGGAIACGISDYRRLRYGPTRDRVLQVRMATGYGKVVTGGSPVVKSSTGYGLPRLATGSFGSLGMIGEIVLKLWPEPPSTVTVEVGDAVAAHRDTYRPLAVLETSEGSFVYLGGVEAQVGAQAGDLGGAARPGLAWPEPISEPIRIEIRIPASHLTEAIEWARRLEAERWIGQHGVGIVSAGFRTIDVDSLKAARAWAESRSGALVTRSMTNHPIDPWGTPPPSIEIQRRIKRAFDPAGICNAGILPGGL